MKKLETTNAAEQNALDAEIADHKHHIQELKRGMHELEAQLADDEAAHQLQQQITARELQAQKEANELLRARNNFLAGWCAEL
jgi:Skp family chaperone for outer membrane proteins